MKASKKDWSVARARQHFSELVGSSRHTPQPIYNRGRLVAAVISAEAFAEFQRWQCQRKSLGDAFRELRSIELEEKVGLTMPQRTDRKNDFPKVIDELSG